jgi:hypothetical protein
MHISDSTVPKDNADARISAAAIQKLGGLASFLMAVTFIVPSLIYLTGNLDNAGGPMAYSVADFLYGPVWAASLVMAVYALRERIGERAPRLMTLALFVSLLAAGAFMTVASIRSANRHYHLIHPQLNLESSATVLTVWTTLIAGMIGAAWHFLGWAFLLVGSAGWMTRRLPRILSALYLIGGGMSLFVYLLPAMEGNAIVLGVVISIWQGFLLLTAPPHTDFTDHADFSEVNAQVL